MEGKEYFGGRAGGAQLPRRPPKTPLPNPFLKGLGEGVWGRGQGPAAPGPLPPPNFSEQLLMGLRPTRKG